MVFVFCAIAVIGVGIIIYFDIRDGENKINEKKYKRGIALGVILAVAGILISLIYLQSA